MKTKSTLLHIISVTIFCLFAALCIGSEDIIIDLLVGSWGVNTEREEDGTKVETKSVSNIAGIATRTTTGETDNKGRWHGSANERVTTVYVSHPTSPHTMDRSYTMVHGKLHGMFITTNTFFDPPSVWIDTTCYHMGEKIKCEDLDRNRTTDTLAYDILVNKYQSHYYDLRKLLFNEDEYIKSYMDTLQKVIGSYDPDINSFDDYYDDAQDELENTLFDSLTLDNGDLAIFNLLDLMKDGRFRLAVLDQYLKGINTLFQTITDYYPGYLSLLDSFEINNEDFEQYCFVFDSLMSQYSPLDIEHFSFPDSMDIRMYSVFNAIDSLYSDGLIGDVVNGKIQIPNDIIQNFETYLNGRGIVSDLNSFVVINSLSEYIFQADIIRQCQRQAYFIKHAAVDYPFVTTLVKSQNSNTEAEIQGFVASDGGGEVTKRGILWAQHYNPTIDDNQENAGSGTGLFSVTLDNLTPGETYYARSFATNSAGTNVGNCVVFIAQQVTGTNETIELTREIKIYPNPASNFIDIVYEKRHEIENIVISDIQGKIVFTKLRNRTVDGPWKLDVSALVDGIYLCNIKYKDGGQSVKKLVVAH